MLLKWFDSLGFRVAGPNALTVASVLDSGGAIAWVNDLNGGKRAASGGLVAVGLPALGLAASDLLPGTLASTIGVTRKL